MKVKFQKLLGQFPRPHTGEERMCLSGEGKKRALTASGAVLS